MSNGEVAAPVAPELPAQQPGIAPPKPGRFRRRRLLVRFAAWGTGAVAAVTIAVLAVQGVTGSRNAAQTVGRLVGDLRALTETSQTTGRELRRFSAAIETLNRDRDRLFTRVTALERGADLPTGSLGGASAAAKGDLFRPQMDAASASKPETDAKDEAEHITATAAGSEDTAGAAAVTDLAARPDPEASVATAATQAVPVDHTEFGIELGTASTVNGLRRLWAATLKAHKSELAVLSPSLAVRERPGGRVEFRLLAGPLRDAAAAARLCATLAAANRTCAPAVFDGQRLELTEAKTEVPIPRDRASPRTTELTPPLR
jgi:hypothetical protein